MIEVFNALLGLPDHRVCTERALSWVGSLLRAVINSLQDRSLGVALRFHKVIVSRLSDCSYSAIDSSC